MLTLLVPGVGMGGSPTAFTASANPILVSVKTHNEVRVKTRSIRTIRVSVTTRNQNPVDARSP
jgi:hypothetical protein